MVNSWWNLFDLKYDLKKYSFFYYTNFSNYWRKTKQNPQNTLFSHIYWWNGFPLVKWCNLIKCYVMLRPVLMTASFVAKLIQTLASFQVSLLETQNQASWYFQRWVLIIRKILFFHECLFWEHSRHTLSFGLGVHALVFNPRTEPAALSYAERALVSWSTKVLLLSFGVCLCEW